MADQLQPKHAASGNEATPPAEFLALCVLAFIAAVAATIYFCCSMAGGMHMPGGWTMSMMWMRMPGQTWLASAISFLLMWLAMMVSMMMPSALPTFLKTRRRWVSLCYMASGYFAIWLATGVGIYVFGVALATVEMRSELISRAVPMLLGASLIAAGAFQFTSWKMTHLLRCRSPFGCAITCPQMKQAFGLAANRAWSVAFAASRPRRFYSPSE